MRLQYIHLPSPGCHLYDVAAKMWQPKSRATLRESNRTAITIFFFGCNVAKTFPTNVGNVTKPMRSYIMLYIYISSVIARRLIPKRS